MVPFLTETDSHDPETGDFGRLLGIYSTFGLCFQLRSRIGAHFPALPDISNAGNYRTFLMRFDSMPPMILKGPLPDRACSSETAKNKPNPKVGWDE